MPATRGLSINESELAPGRVAESIDTYGPAVSAGQPCAERFSLLAEAADALLADGIDVVVVGLPALDAFAALHPDGADGWRQNLLDELAAMPAGVEIVDLTAPLPDELFNDAWHLTTDGRRQLTDQLAASL